MEEEYLNVSPARVAQALAADYFCIYYVNTKNNKFIEYSASRGSVLSQSYIRKIRSGFWMDS